MKMGGYLEANPSHFDLHHLKGKQVYHTNPGREWRFRGRRRHESRVEGSRANIPRTQGVLVTNHHHNGH